MMSHSNSIPETPSRAVETRTHPSTGTPRFDRDSPTRIDDRTATSSPTPPTIPDSSRRALVGSALDSIQRFKQSWKSIMFLKAGIGLGQVVVLVVLLILASVLPSPLCPSAKQVDSTDVCPHPGLFQAWMIVQIFRLTTCWAVSCWVAVRAQRALRRDHQANDQEAATTSTPAAWNRYGSPRTPRSGSQPSLTNSSSSSESTLGGLCSSNRDRSNSTDVGGIAAMHSSSATFTIVNVGGIESHKINSSSPAIASDPHLTMIRTPETPSTPSDYDTRRNSQRPRSLACIEQEVDENQDAAPRDFASLLDRLAPFANKALGLISLVLFVLGNILLFYPSPVRQTTCYHSAPMLWWGTMVVTGVGWFLFWQVIFVVAVVGIGGHAVLSILRRLHIVPTPPEPEPPRPPQPDPLSPQELARLKVVCFVPHPDSPSAPVTPTSAKSMADAQSQPSQLSTPSAQWDWTRFPYPAHYLKPNKAMCAICQENFTEPRVIRRILYQAEPLRILGCGHVYHTECVDKWLTEKSGICPFCNTSVRSTLATEKVESQGTPETPRRWWGTRRGQDNQSSSPSEE